VLGTRLGESTSYYRPELEPSEGFVHVDVDTDVFGAAYPAATTFGIQAEIGAFVDALVEQWPDGPRSASPSRPALRKAPAPLQLRSYGPVRPRALMQAIQRHVVRDSSAVLMSEAGNAFVWATHELRFDAPGRYRVSSGFGSMGHAATGIVGVAAATGQKAVAILGDGAMLMQSEISTAAYHELPAVWIVLNDARYGMIEQGMRSLGWTPFGVDIPPADFVLMARAMGGDGVRVEHESELPAALRLAMVARGPFVVDVQIDPTERAPAARRNETLTQLWGESPRSDS
jgi:acetolactate synthase-1/2/3 large subunit